MPDFIIRGSQPIDRAAIARVVAHAFEAVEIDPSDPFLIDDPCEKNGGGPHADIVECHVVKCSRCGRIVWA